MMRSKISNLSSLVDFECAARWQSIKLAAKELNKTPSAVSQQIKLLEQQLGFALFERKTRQIHLTDKGMQFSATAHRLLKELDIAITNLQGAGETNSLHVSTIHAFAMKYLVARLPRFTSHNPEVDVHIDSSHRLADMQNDQTDIAIRYAQLNRYPQKDLLRREQLIAVYSPELAQADLYPADLVKFPLLYENTKTLWIKWMQLNNCLDDRHQFAQNFSHSGLLVQAAVSGYGIALAPETIAHDDLQAGNLKRLAASQLPSEYGYFFLANDISANAPKSVRFRAWLEEELALIKSP